LVSHDRAFLNNLVTSTLVMSGDGEVREYVGGYDDWQRQRQAELAEEEAKTQAKKPAVPAPPIESSSTGGTKKLSYKEQRAREAEQRELAELPGRIEALEAEQHHLNTAMADASFYQRDSTEISRDVERVRELEAELSQLYARWEELEQKNGS
jgi:ABC transport system ATP-binding/permease protein